MAGERSTVMILRDDTHGFLSDALTSGYLNGQALIRVREVMGENEKLQREITFLRGRVAVLEESKRHFQKIHLDALEHELASQHRWREGREFRFSVFFAVAAISSALTGLVMTLALVL